MLIESDFVKHGFKPWDHARLSKEVNFTFRDSAGVMSKEIALLFERLKKGTARVTLFKNGKNIDSEFMWSPEELRLFLVKNNLIVEKSKP